MRPVRGKEADEVYCCFGASYFGLRDGNRDRAAGRRDISAGSTHRREKASSAVRALAPEHRDQGVEAGPVQPRSDLPGVVNEALSPACRPA